MKNESFDLEQNHSLYHQLMQVLHITCLEVQAKAILEENKYTQASDRHKNAEGVWARDQIEPSEHLWTKINNPIAAVSGCPQALDSLNYLSVVARWGQGCLPLSVCLRAETSERVSSITALPTAPRSSISSLLLQPDHSTVSQSPPLSAKFSLHYKAKSLRTLLFSHFFFFFLLGLYYIKGNLAATIWDDISGKWVPPI